MYGMTGKGSVIESRLFPKAAKCKPARWLIDVVTEGWLFSNRSLAILVLDILPNVLECGSVYLYD